VLSPERLAAYRRMSLDERAALTARLMREGLAAMLQGDPAVVTRRFEVLRRQNEERTRRICEGLRRARDADG
jgi:hypothetical protein